MFKIKLSLVLLSVFIILGCGKNSDAMLANKAGAPLLTGLGNHSHDISSNVYGVQRYFNQGMIMVGHG